MEPIRITSVHEPFDSRRIARLAIGVISTAEAMGLLDGVSLERLDWPSFQKVADRLMKAGIGRDLRAAFSAKPRVKDAEVGELLDRLAIAVEESPVPSHEWRSLEQILGPERLASLVGISPVSVRRYRKQERSTPDAVAARLHFVAALVGDLRGAYTDAGIQRWFDRPRQLLDGKAPAELLRDDWSPDDSTAQKVRDLARSLVASNAT